MSDKVHREGWIRDPQSFKDIYFIEISDRTILKKYSDEESYAIYEPSYITTEEFKLKLSVVGNLDRFEEYLCPKSFLYTSRGWVTKEDNKDYFFYLSNRHPGKYLESDVSGVIAQLQYSGREHNVK